VRPCLTGAARFQQNPTDGWADFGDLPGVLFEGEFWIFLVVPAALRL